MSEGVVKNMNTYEVVTERIIEAIEKNKTLPWRKPWRTGGSGQLPRNLASNREYRGVNVFLLSMMGFDSPYWVTFKQAKTLGGSVRKGQKGSPVIFWSILERKNEKTGKLEKIPFIKHSTLFNVCQCDGLTVPDASELPKAKVDPIDACEAIVNGFVDHPEIVEREQQAYYSLAQDIINMPKRDTFESSEEYYSVLFHEFGHSTLHPDRLNRIASEKKSFFGSDSYSKEELIAEFSASFLCAHAGIDSATIDNSVAYLQGWVSALRERPRMLVEAAAQAQKAADYILGKHNQSEENQ